MSSDKFHCTNGHCLTDCALSSIDYDKDFPPTFCPHSGIAVKWAKCETNQKKATLFDHVTSSPEVIAEKLVYVTYHELPFDQYVETWHSTLSTMKFKTKEEAIAATVEKLKEVAKLDEADNG